MQTELRYRLQDLKQDFRADSPLVDTHRRTHLRSNELELSNTIFLSADRRSSLLSFLRYYEESGSQDLKNYYWQERLLLRHTPNFSTYYLASLLRNKFESSTVDTKRGEIGLDHRLYQSLDTHLDVHGRQTDFDELTDREWGVTGRLAYRKKTPLGNLLMSYARTLDQIDRSGASGRARYFDESLVLTSSRTQFLANPNVDGDSLYVTDAAGTTPYIEDLDYTLETRGNRTGLRLKRGGRLSEGATVLVDYDVEMTSDINYTADDQDFYLRYDFARALQGLGVYYRRHNLTPRGADTTDDMSILEFTDQLYGFNYNWRSLTWTEEYETYSSNFTNYDQTLSQLEGFHRVLNTLKWSWQTGLQTVQYHDDDREDGEDHSRILFAGATLNGPVSSRGYWELEARINKETGIIDETFTGVSGRLGMRWRKVKIEAGARLEQRERFDDTRDRAHVFFRFAREF